MATIKSKPKYGLSLEVHDGLYQVIRDNEIVDQTRVLAAAEVVYEELLANLSSGARNLLAKESAHYTLQAVRSDAFERRAGNARKKGGRGGRGGV